MKVKVRNRYASIPKRSYRNAITRLLEEQYKIVGSHKVLQMMANNIVEQHKEFYPEVDKQHLGHIVWRTTGANCKKPSYCTCVEDYEVKTVILPLVSEQDVETRMANFYGHDKDNEKNYQRQNKAEDLVRA